MGRVPPGAAPAATPLPPRQGVFARAAGVIRRPRDTMARLEAAPRWIDVLVLYTVAAAVALALLYSTEIGRQALVDQWERTSFAFGREVDDREYARLVAMSEIGAAYGAGVAVANGPVTVIAVAALLFGALRRGSGGPRFRQVLAVSAHAGLLLALRQIVAAPIAYARETTASATSLGVWFPLFDEGSAAARFLGMIDLFVLWWAVVLAIGIAGLYGRPTRPLAGAFVGVYVGLAALLAGVMAVLGGLS